MLFNTRKFLLGFVLSLCFLPMMAFAATQFKGTETVNINKANAATLAAYLKGIGPNKAEAIVKYRKSNGNFKSLTDLKKVPGIGEKTFKDIKSKISTSRGKSSAPKGYKVGETSGKSNSIKKKPSNTTKKSPIKKTTNTQSTVANKELKSTGNISSKSKKSTVTKSTTAKLKETSSKGNTASKTKKSTAKQTSTAKKAKAKTSNSKNKASSQKKTVKKTTKKKKSN